jgi:hypothetical protein
MGASPSPSSPSGSRSAWPRATGGSANSNALRPSVATGPSSTRPRSVSASRCSCRSPWTGGRSHDRELRERPGRRSGGTARGTAVRRSGLPDPGRDRRPGRIPGAAGREAGHSARRAAAQLDDRDEARRRRPALPGVAALRRTVTAGPSCMTEAWPAWCTPPGALPRAVVRVAINCPGSAAPGARKYLPPLDRHPAACTSPCFQVCPPGGYIPVTPSRWQCCAARWRRAREPAPGRPG